MYFPPESNNKMESVRRESEGTNRCFECEMVDGESPRENGQDRPAIFVNRQKQISVRREVKMCDILSV